MPLQLSLNIPSTSPSQTLNTPSTPATRWDLADDPSLRYGLIRAFDHAMRVAEAEGEWLSAPAPRTEVAMAEG